MVMNRHTLNREGIILIVKVCIVLICKWLLAGLCTLVFAPWKMILLQPQLVFLFCNLELCYQINELT